MTFSTKYLYTVENNALTENAKVMCKKKHVQY